MIDELRICKAYRVPYWIVVPGASRPSWLRRPIWRWRAWRWSREGD